MEKIHYILHYLWGMKLCEVGVGGEAESLIFNFTYFHIVRPFYKKYEFLYFLKKRFYLTGM